MVSRVNRRLPLLDRQCGECEACCTTQRVPNFIDPKVLASDLFEGDESRIVDHFTIERDGSVTKKQDVPCPCLEVLPDKHGCMVYDKRPDACRKWECVWRSGSPVLEGPERPDRIGVVFDTVVDKRLPFTFLVAVAVDPTNTAPCFERAKATLERLARRGHLVVCEAPDGLQLVLGPEGKKEAYLATRDMDNKAHLKRILCK